MTVIYNLNQRTVEEVSERIRQLLGIEEKMEVQQFTDLNGTIFVQARDKNGKYTQFLGMDKTITVRIRGFSENRITVEIGKGKWIDKCLVFTTSMIILWPLAITSGYGFYKQKKLPEKIYGMLDTILIKELKIEH